MNGNRRGNFAADHSSCRRVSGGEVTSRGRSSILFTEMVISVPTSITPMFTRSSDATDSARDAAAWLQSESFTDYMRRTEVRLSDEVERVQADITVRLGSEQYQEAWERAMKNAGPDPSEQLGAMVAVGFC